MGINKNNLNFKKNNPNEIYRTGLSDSNSANCINVTWELKEINRFENSKKKVVFYEITRFLCVKSKNTHEQIRFKISTFMCMPSLRTIYET